MIIQNQFNLLSIMVDANKIGIRTALEYVQQELNDIDNKISKENDSSIFYVKEFRSRRLWTPFGDVDFRRRIYVNRRSGKLKY